MKVTLSSAMRSTAAAPSSSVRDGIEGVTQAIADEVEAKEQRNQKPRGHEQHPRRRQHLPRALVDEAPQARARLLHAQAEKAEEALVGDQLRDDELAIHRYRPGEVGRVLFHKDAPTSE